MGCRGDTSQIHLWLLAPTAANQDEVAFTLLVLGFSYAEYFPFVPLLPPSHLSLLVCLHLQQFQISSQHPLHPLALLFIA